MPKAKIEIIYQDSDIIVINKPSGISVSKDRSGIAELRDVLGEQIGPQICRKLRLVHRLDKDTSGVMVLALNVKTQSLFSSYFAEKLVKKTYLAIVTGAVTAPQGTINACLCRSRRNPALMCIAAKKGKESTTNWRLLADFGIAALLAVNPLTGRTHQIRVHLPSIGLPLAIDQLYGNRRPLFLSDFKPNYCLGKDQIEKPLIERLTLHAYQIEFPESPTRPNCFIARLDKKFAATIKMLAKYNPLGPAAFSNPDDFSKIINGLKL